MVDNETLEEVRRLVHSNFHFPQNPRDILWTDLDGEPWNDIETMFDDCGDYDDVRCGCSKIVLFPYYLNDFVIKIPFLGERNGEEFYKFSNIKCFDFNHRFKTGWDHCELEAYVYQLAVKNNIADMFCGTYYIGDFEGFPLYISEKSGKIIDEDLIHHPSEAAKKYTLSKAPKDSQPNSWNMPAGMEPDALGLFYDFWGKESTDKLVNFIVDNKIQDCHNGNVAFKDDKICIIDYPGFYK